jgi:hypothetical protein
LGYWKMTGVLLVAVVAVVAVVAAQFDRDFRRSLIIAGSRRARRPATCFHPVDHVNSRCRAVAQTSAGHACAPLGVLDSPVP